MHLNELLERHYALDAKRTRRQDRKMSGTTLYRFVILRPADGSMIMVATPSQDAEQTLATLRAHLPHAIVGYGRAQQASYDAARRAM